MFNVQLKWTGINEMLAAMDAYADKVEHAVKMVADYWAPVMEAYAKENAPWTDRTANARQGLRAFTEQLSQDTVVLYLTHGVEYGIHLEVRNSGENSIIWPTIEAHLPQIEKMLQEIFG